MSSKRNSPQLKVLIGDFETTVYDGQADTAVWASAVVELGTEDVQIFHSIDETFGYLKKLNTNILIYYHNLKFDGSFWLDFLINTVKMQQAIECLSEEQNQYRFLKNKEMKTNTFKYAISDMGQWYSITIKLAKHTIEIRDSLKLLPFSVKKIGKSFGTKHKKLDMEYKGFRFAGCTITDEEKKYIANDVLVVKEALEIMYSEGHNKLTIGACCLSEYKNILSKEMYDVFFPNVYDIEINSDEHFYSTAGDWIRKSYKGGWCYLVHGKENKVRHNGVTADVNSLYPSVMSSQSGCRYPIGRPTFWTGNYIPNFPKDFYYFVRIRTRFYIKDGYLPFIQIKNSCNYKGTECLRSSDVFNKETGKYYRQYRDADGNIHEAIVELTMTMTDYILFREHYNVEDFEIIDGCYFESEIGIFDDYIDKYKKIKMTSKGARRELAKLFLNNLYGKMASSMNSSFKIAYRKDDGSIGFFQVQENDKKPGYIPVGSAITSYARNFTIRAAQKNYHGVNQRGFIYADTDSIHCDLPPDKIKGITVHDSEFCCWKLEATWDTAYFTRQKTYIEHVVAENLEPIEKPYYNVKCAGMPDKCKQLFIRSLENNLAKEDEELEENERKFLSKKRELTDFKLGLKVPGKLLPLRIKGGVVLVDTTYEMR